MKKIYLSIILLVVISANSQVRLVSTLNTSVNSSAFIDASSQNSNNITVGTGKGLVYPRVDLTTFQFVSGTTGIGSSFPTRYDGMVVYNTVTGNTSSLGATAIIAVTPGFWYYDNKSTNVKGGTWTQLGSNVKNYTTTPIKTATSIDGAQVWAVKGSFVASGTSALVSVVMPAGMTGYYKMTTYQLGKTFRSDISEFKMTTTVPNTDNVVTGNGLFSEVYPAGTYEYTLEYFQ
jgi:hypothetical protein